MKICPHCPPAFPLHHKSVTKKRQYSSSAGLLFPFISENHAEQGRNSKSLSGNTFMLLLLPILYFSLFYDYGCNWIPLEVSVRSKACSSRRETDPSSFKPAREGLPCTVPPLQTCEQELSSTPRKKSVQVPARRSPALIRQTQKSKEQALFVTFTF